MTSVAQAKFTLLPTRLPEIKLIQPRCFEDSRGYFLELYHQKDFEPLGISEPVRQTNWSSSRQGVVRGLHFQKSPYGMSKLVSCPQGEIFDVVVDLRPRSSTFGQWEGVTLSDHNKQVLYIPEGFAHGFCVLSETALVLYHCNEFYQAEYDAGVRWNDPTIGVQWPISVPILSEKDQNLPFLTEVQNQLV